MPPITVYRASAGSGKTFTLAVKYIELLLRDPLSYKTTLAVTFTNKATEEMKTRILSQLYGLWKGLADSDDYLKEIVRDTALSAEKVRENAGLALSFIVHDYNYFAIETIDSFFQRVLRNLARELDLTANLRVELNATDVEHLAVDRLIENLSDTSAVLSWILTYIEEAISDDKGWNVINKIKRFGESIFSDAYRQHANALEAAFASEDFFNEYRHQLSRIIEQTTERLSSFAVRFNQLLEENALSPADFAYTGSGGPADYFQKLADGNFDEKNFNSYVRKAHESADGWVKKAFRKSGNANYDLAESTLVDLLREAEDCRSRETKLLRSARVTLRHLHELRLLNSIKTQVNAINSETNSFLLSDTQTLLYEIMKDSDAPFVFEKIGGQLRHIMIDEFQDTATVQWNNFKKLLAESMSHDDSSNLIVGDVKQSIYRWRSGDWHLLHNIEKEDLFRHTELKSETLDRNFRSERNIVHFNNQFFLRLAQHESSSLTSEGISEAKIIEEIYHPTTLIQIPNKTEAQGLVRIDFLTNDDYDSEARRLTRDHIQMLIDAGASEDSIAIITRTNDEIRFLAETLQEEMPHLNFISEEAFHLDASRAVNIIISAMRVILQPGDSLQKAQLEKLSGLPANEILDRRHHLFTLPLRDLSEEIFRIFQLHTISHEAAYICAFNDQISDYTQHNLPILSEFLEAWDDTIHEKSVQGGVTQGIRLITIHKSKGLEFDHVIMPYTDWQLDKNSRLWSSTSVEPFGLLPVIPLDWRSIKGTIFQSDYNRERLEKCIDDINTLYVAFTRAAKNLFIITKRKASSNYRARVIYNIVEQMLAERDSLADLLPEMQVEGDFENKASASTFSLGSLFVKRKEEKPTTNVFLQHRIAEPVLLKPAEVEVEFRQSNQSKRFVSEETDADQQRYINIGTLLHQLLSRIRTLDDIDAAIRDFEQEGVVYTDNLDRDSLSKLIRERMENEQVARWFSSDVEAYTECPIIFLDQLTGKLQSPRPDRVVRDGDKWIVIDFKFAAQSPAHHEQVARYMQLLRQMGHSKVEGFLWYVYQNKIVEVENL